MHITQALGDCPSNTNRKGKDLVELLGQSNFIQVEIPEPTRFPYTTHGSMTSPDKILATMPIFNRIKSITTHPAPNTDHAPILATIFTPNWTPSTQTSRKTILDYAKADWKKFQNELNTRLKEKDYITTTDIDMQDTEILNAILEAQKNSIPAKNIKINPNRQNKPLPKFLLDIIKI